jgi:hypothetical protein
VSEESFLAENAAKWGDEAARERLRARRLIQVKLPIAAILVGSIIEHIIDRRSFAADVVACVALGLIIVNVILIIWLFWRANTAATETLGVPVNWHSSPPNRPAAYLIWCQQNNLVAYNASKRRPGIPKSGASRHAI